MTIHLFKHAKDQETYAAGQTIFEVGQPGEIMYVVTEGEVQIKIGDKVIDTIGPGDILGEMALIDIQPRSATAIAITECQLAPIDTKRFEFLVQQTPHFAIQVMQTMAKRLRQALAQL